ncbi:MAG: glutaredoxin family protein [Asgard group archaeon]|nr:glutaredoxin family protein [Asgard group archaeon]
MHENLEFITEKGDKTPCDIQIYALSTCGFCKRGLEFLRKNSITFRYIYVDQLDKDLRYRIKRELLDKFDERIAFPYVLVDKGEKVIVGFTEDKWKDAFLIE